MAAAAMCRFFIISAVAFLVLPYSVCSLSFEELVSVLPAPAPSPTSLNPGIISSNPGVSFPFTSSGEERMKNKKEVVVATGLGIGVAAVAVVLALAIYGRFKKTRGANGGNQITLGRPTDSDLEMAAKSILGRRQSSSMDSGLGKAGSGQPKKFAYGELEFATNNFSEQGKLGEGGFGQVYRGLLRDMNMEVAVKRFSSDSFSQGVDEYASEVKIISRLRHRNLVPLHGWCHEKGELLLVYEYMPHGSLHSHLFKERPSKSPPLNWQLRYRIAHGLASALSYLQEDCEQCVLHRDIKSSNVLLDSSFNARLGDFGLAWMVDHGKTYETLYLAGTPGYVAPECIYTFKTTKESDVYSFGIVILEIASGRRAIIAANGPEGEKISLVEWVWDLYGLGRLLEAADPKLCGDFKDQEMERLMIIGLWCAHPDKESRPKINQALQCLKFQQARLPVLPSKMPKPVYPTLLPFSSSLPHSHTTVDRVIT